MLLALAVCTASAVLNIEVAECRATIVVLLGPVLACLRLDRRRTAVVAGWALLCGLGPLCGALLWPEVWPGLDAGSPLSAAGLCAVCPLTVYAASLHTALNASLTEITQVARAAQEAIVRPLPETLDGVRFTLRDRPAVRQSVFCGDVYAAVSGPSGARLMVADACGHDLGTMRLAATAVAGFRDLAGSAPDLRELARALDSRVRPELGPEDFVTLVLAEFRPGEVVLANCGHPAPVRAGGGRVELLEPAAPSPPLGLWPDPDLQRVRFQAGDRLLFYTDGLTEPAEYADAPFPLLEYAGKALGEPLPADALERMEALAVDRARGPERADDILLVLCEQAEEPDPDRRAAGGHSTTISTGMLPRVARE
ncbi:PP2C family protein-serine/threonine phosphatase [Streptomyces sp. NPDC051940]|uniref:PP2C family protein-serine/threonine phosphatase n=1 Tax=Streptomyces sp. NPDC051940 TaxID=3155675 RepID=UPI00342485D9